MVPLRPRHFDGDPKHWTTSPGLTYHLQETDWAFRSPVAAVAKALDIHHLDIRIQPETFRNNVGLTGHNADDADVRTSGFSPYHITGLHRSFGAAHATISLLSSFGSSRRIQSSQTSRDPNVVDLKALPL